MCLIFGNRKTAGLELAEMPMAGIFMGMAVEELDGLGMAAAEVVAAYGHDGIMLLLEACCRLEVSASRSSGLHSCFISQIRKSWKIARA